MISENNSPDAMDGNTVDECPKLSVDAQIDPSLLSSCIHCGLCLPACPTYLATGREMESPRGRLYLLGLWQGGNKDQQIVEHIESCLGCLGCQTACPSGVNYSTILEQARESMAPFVDRRKRRWQRFVFTSILPDYKKLQSIGKLLRAWQLAQGPRFTSRIPWFKKSLKRLVQLQSFLPQIPKYIPLPRKSWISGTKCGEVNLFTGCVMNIFYNHVNHACQRLLINQRQIVCVPDQTCCGALAAHAGEMDIAKNVAKKNIELFENLSGDIVVTAAGCGAMLKNYKNLFEKDEQWDIRAQKFSKRVVDITEFLAAHKFGNNPAVLKRKVAYHAACHLYHAQKIMDAPVSLLAGLTGVESIPLNEADQCCGSAGIFNVTHSELSLDILKRKIDNILDTGAQEVVTTNPGCLLQIETGIKQAKANVKVRHLAELLDEAYNQEP